LFYYTIFGLKILPNPQKQAQARACFSILC